MRCSVLDLGSNSFHVLVADLDGRSISPVLRQREMLHLGRIVARHGVVPDAERRRAITTVAHFAELARRSGAEESVAVATAALRDATNGPEVIADLSAAAHTEVRVLDGREEARLAHRGVRASVAVGREPVLVLDLGGGSLELAIGGETTTWAASTQLGVSRLSASVEHDPPKKREVKALRRRVDAELEPHLDAVAHHPGTVVAVGGTVRALARIVAAEGAVWLPATINQLQVSTSQLTRVRDELLALEHAGRLAVPGMKPTRADHLHIAAVVLCRVLKRLDVRAVTVSDWGLREGLLLDVHGRDAPPDALQLRSGEIERIRCTFAPDDPHPLHVAGLALQLFDGTRQLHRLADDDRELLDHAARVHTIGEALALRRQHLHGAYLIENAELRGFSPAETAMLTTLVRFHPSRGIDPEYPAYASLSQVDQQRTRRLLAILQVADGLDRARDQAVTEVRVRPSTAGIRLVLKGGGLQVSPTELERRMRSFTTEFEVVVTIHDEATG